MVDVVACVVVVACGPVVVDAMVVAGDAVVEAPDALSALLLVHAAATRANAARPDTAMSLLRFIPVS
jgi:hypothetical protein